jgi:DNA-binding XRE family transcriptional regulator
MQYTDSSAARLLTELREGAGLSPEGLSRAIFAAGLGYVAGRTIRNIEKREIVPTLRVRTALARYFDRPARSVWRTAPTVMDRRDSRVAA